MTLDPVVTVASAPVELNELGDGEGDFVDGDGDGDFVDGDGDGAFVTVNSLLSVSFMLLFVIITLPFPHATSTVSLFTAVTFPVNGMPKISSMALTTACASCSRLSHTSWTVLLNLISVTDCTYTISTVDASRQCDPFHT